MTSQPPAALNLSRPIFITEIEQFGGAERSLLALSGWLYRQQLPHYLLTYIDHCNLAQYATHPVTIVALNPGSGVRNKVAGLKKHFAERGASAIKPLLSGYQPGLHGTLAGLKGAHDLMHDTASLFGERDKRSFKAKLRVEVQNRIIGYGLRSGGKTIVTSEYLQGECWKDFGVRAEIARMGGLGQGDAPAIRPVGDELRLLSFAGLKATRGLTGFCGRWRSWKRARCRCLRG